jgi:fumarate reductase subunit C
VINLKCGDFTLVEHSSSILDRGLIIVALNGKLVYDEITGWLEASENPIVLWLTVVPLALSFLILLLYIVFKPFVKIKNRNSKPFST